MSGPPSDPPPLGEATREAAQQLRDKVSALREGMGRLLERAAGQAASVPDAGQLDEVRKERDVLAARLAQVDRQHAGSRSMLCTAVYAWNTALALLALAFSLCAAPAKHLTHFSFLPYHYVIILYALRLRTSVQLSSRSCPRKSSSINAYPRLPRPMPRKRLRLPERTEDRQKRLVVLSLSGVCCRIAAMVRSSTVYACWTTRR